MRGIIVKVETNVTYIDIQNIGQTDITRLTENTAADFIEILKQSYLRDR